MPTISTKILYSLGNELGILDKILKYDSFCNDIYKRMKDGYHLDKSRLCFKDLVHYNNLKKLMINILNGEDANYLFEKMSSQVKTNRKILRVNFGE